MLQHRGVSLVIVLILFTACDGEKKVFTSGGDDDCNSGVWNGNREIHDQTGLEALSGYTEINGDLEISNSALQNLDALICMERIHGSLSVVNNSALGDIDGLSGVTEVGGGLSIRSCGSVTSFSLNDLTSVGGSVSIGENGSLADFSMASLSSTSDWVGVDTNDMLDNFELGALQQTGGFLNLASNQHLSQFNLGSLTQVDGDLWITTNPGLPTCLGTDLAEQIVSLSGGVCIQDNQADSCDDIDSGC